MADILKRILNADMAVCDLSSRNPNVLYELAVRQSFDLPVVLIKDDVTKEPFDIYGIRYLEYDKELRIDLVAKAVDDLTETISETVANKDKDIFSLVQILGREKAAVKSTDVTPDTLAILEAITALGNSNNKNQRKLQDPPLYKYSMSFFEEADFDEKRFSSALNRILPTGANTEYHYHKSGDQKIVVADMYLFSIVTHTQFLEAARQLSPANLISVSYPD